MGWLSSFLPKAFFSGRIFCSTPILFLTRLRFVPCMCEVVVRFVEPDNSSCKMSYVPHLQHMIGFGEPVLCLQVEQTRLKLDTGGTNLVRLHSGKKNVHFCADAWYYLSPNQWIAFRIHGWPRICFSDKEASGPIYKTYLGPAHLTPGSMSDSKSWRSDNRLYKKELLRYTDQSHAI